MKQATLCYLIKDNKILLAMKKKGFGAGKWNGVGGKLDHNKGDKDIIDTAIRETEEEIGVRIKNPEKIAVLSYYFPYISNKNWDQDVHVFLVRNWESEPIESIEMLPKWFKVGEIPFEQMWDDDKYWFPPFLEGKRFNAKFIFEEGEKVSEKEFEFLEN
jgi:8-oxo-dGTP pyrophosphatase MutT (NUDIX family)